LTSFRLLFGPAGLRGARFNVTIAMTCLAERAARAGLDRHAFEETKMPKMKTKSGVKKRFTLTATGKLKHGVAGKRHRLMSHNSKYIRQNRGTSVLSDADTATVKAWAPYGLK
jgi:large subunit ribosomal protein L35